MKSRVYNFSPGPAMLPEPVLRQVQEEFLSYRGIGASVVEISHRSKEFEAIVDEAMALFRELASLPSDFSVLFVHGGARLQFAAMPMNLIARVPSRKALYVESGPFASIAAKEAKPYGDIRVIASSKETGFNRIPALDSSSIEQDAAYLHITTNNTIVGTRWNQFPNSGKVPLIGDCTSEILSRKVDYSRFGALYAGFQKNLGTAGTALVAIRNDLLGSAMPETPAVINYAQLAKEKSLLNTPNTFAIYVTKLVLQWVKEMGGVSAMEQRNEAKAKILYDLLDNSRFYKPFARREDRSIMNVTFNLPKPELEAQFVKEAAKEGMIELKGHRSVGGIRASIYNAMPLEGVQALASFMTEFERKNG